MWSCAAPTLPGRYTARHCSLCTAKENTAQTTTTVQVSDKSESSIQLPCWGNGCLLGDVADRPTAVPGMPVCFAKNRLPTSTAYIRTCLLVGRSRSFALRRGHQRQESVRMRHVDSYGRRTHTYVWQEERNRRLTLHVRRKARSKPLHR
jgi:hypothetical protein